MTAHSDLSRFNCARCGEPHYNHGPGHSPEVCDEYQAPKQAASATPLTAVLPPGRTDGMEINGYLDAMDLHAETALGRLNAAAKRVRSRAGEGLHDEMVKLLREAYEAGKREAVENPHAST